MQAEGAKKFVSRSAAMTRIQKTLSALGLGGTLSVAFILSACDQKVETQQGKENAPSAEQSAAPTSIPMGGTKSVTRFFVTSKGLGKGGDLGGLAGADAHCQALAQAQGAGDRGGNGRRMIRRR